jgi:sulfate adenylyltransferase subunit 1 (EFTu-like GTPase family)
MVAVNKMDLVDYAEARFDELRRDFGQVAGTLAFKDVTFVPVSALRGENVVERSRHMPWYGGPTVLGFLEEVPIAADRNLDDFRYPVQYVLRPNLDYRGFAAQIASGVVKKGDEILVLPSGKTSRVKAIDTFEGELEEAFAPQSVTLRLADEVDCSRGDLLVHPDNRPRVQRSFDADVVWMHERALDPAKTYFLKHTTRTVRVQIDRVHWRLDLSTLATVPATTLELNDIGRLSLTCHQPLYYDGYTKNRATGSFVIVDSLTNNTVGAGMIRDQAPAQALDAALREAQAGVQLPGRSQVSPREREQRIGQTGVAVLLSASPARARDVAFALERRLYDLGHGACVLAFDDEPPAAVALAARACAEAGLIALCASAADGARLRAAIGERLLETDASDGTVEAAAERVLSDLAARGQIPR